MLYLEWCASESDHMTNSNVQSMYKHIITKRNDGVRVLLLQIAFAQIANEITVLRMYSKHVKKEQNVMLVGGTLKYI